MNTIIRNLFILALGVMFTGCLNEEFNGYNVVKPFEEVSGSLVSVDVGLDSLTDKYTKTAFPPIGSILGSIVLYLSLLFPYYLQDRHTKSQLRLLGMEKGASHSSSSITFGITRSSKKNNEQKQTITIESYEDEKTSTPVSSNSDEDDDYVSFTM